MTHARNELIDEVAEKMGLIPGLNVTKSRFYPVSVLPSAVVYVVREDAQHINLAKDIERELQIQIEVIAEGNETVDDDLGNLCEQIEAKISEDSTLDSKCREVFLRNTEIDYIPEGDRPHAKATIAYSIFYTTTFTDPSGAIS